MREYIKLLMLPGFIFLLCTTTQAQTPSHKNNRIDNLIKPPYNNYINYGICFAAGCLLISLLWYLKFRQRKNTQINRETKKMSPEETRNREISLIEKENIEFVSKFKILNHRIKELEDKLINFKKAEDKIVELENTIKNLKNSASEKIDIPIEDLSQNASKYLFFPSPLPDGSFRKVDGKSTFLEGASIYRFKIVSETEARFEFCEDSSSIGMALNNRADLILNVAEEMEGNSSGARKILTYRGEEGKAILEDSKWLVIKKIKIKYV